MSAAQPGLNEGCLSPDLADAVVLTFAPPVSVRRSNFHRKIEYTPTGYY